MGLQAVADRARKYSELEAAILAAMAAGVRRKAQLSKEPVVLRELQKLDRVGDGRFLDYRLQALRERGTIRHESAGSARGWYVV